MEFLSTWDKVPKAQLLEVFERGHFAGLEEMRTNGECVLFCVRFGSKTTSQPCFRSDDAFRSLDYLLSVAASLALRRCALVWSCQSSHYCFDVHPFTLANFLHIRAVFVSAATAMSAAPKHAGAFVIYAIRILSTSEGVHCRHSWTRRQNLSNDHRAAAAELAAHTLTTRMAVTTSQLPTRDLQSGCSTGWRRWV